jgi:DNA polymerase-3 subunit beta
MKVAVNQVQLAHGLSTVSRAVSPRSTLPVLANILIATDEGRLRLSATNLELGITCWIAEEGSITIPARTFLDLVNTLPGSQVEMKLDSRTQTLRVKCGTNVTDIKGIDAQEFPPMPVPDLEEGIDLNVADFKEMIQQVVFAASTDEARPVLQGVAFSANGNEIVLAATDGYRVSVRKASLANPVQHAINAIIPARALSELARIATDGTQAVNMIIPPGRGQVLFHLKDAELVSQLIDGNFPDYKAIIPRSAKMHTIISTSDFVKACKQVEIIARDSNNIVRLNIKKQGDAPGAVEISAQSEETGNSEVVLDATVEGDDHITIAFNVRYLREVLEVVRTPNVVLETNMHNSPGMVKPVGSENYTHVIMPMTLP